MTIREGRKYRLRNGTIVGPITPTNHKIFVWGYVDPDGREITWKSNGSYWFDSGNNPDDIIEEVYEEPVINTKPIYDMTFADYKRGCENLAKRGNLY